MKDPSKYLKEGEYYPFRVVRNTLLPDGSSAWMLEDLKQQKILLEKKNYRHYAFSTGQVIQCRVDKINCSGKVFLEPPHPYYQEGLVFEFDLIRFVSPGIAVVRDVFGNDLNVAISELSLNESETGKLSLLVSFIQKGIPRLSDPHLPELVLFEAGKAYLFHVIGNEKLANEQEYMILADGSGNRHLLLAEWYRHFDVQPGTDLLCEIVKMKDGVTPVLEPVHPEYFRDEVYELKFIRFEEAVSSKGEFRKLVVVGNEKGEEFFILRKHFSDNEIPGQILCKVEKYRKGQVFFEPIAL